MISTGFQPFFSIVLATFNRAHLIARALDSVTRQSFADWELIVMDDGSRDNTFETVRPYVESDPRIRYHFAQNKGLAAIRNLGASMSNGYYITFLDSDDQYLQNHLQLRHDYLVKHPRVELLHGGIEVIGTDVVADKYDPTKLIPLSECVIGGTFVIHRGLLDKLNGFGDIEYGDDRDFFDRAVMSGAHIAKIEAPTYRYYRNEPDSLCNIAERGGLEAIRKFRRGNG